VKTMWGTLTARRPIYVPSGRLTDLATVLGDAAKLAVTSPGRSWDSDYKVALFTSVGAAETALNMGRSAPLDRSAWARNSADRWHPVT